MADYLFVSQDMIDSWLMEGKIDFSGTVMSIRGEARSYDLEPAVRFVRVVGDEEDSPGLVAKVKTLDQVIEIGGEHYHDSVVLGDVAYDVQNGFIARVHVSAEVEAKVAAATAGESEQNAPPSPAARASVEESPVEGSAAEPVDSGEGKVDESDANLLTRFLLENLR